MPKKKSNRQLLKNGDESDDADDDESDDESEEEVDTGPDFDEAVERFDAIRSLHTEDCSGT